MSHRPAATVALCLVVGLALIACSGPTAEPKARDSGPASAPPDGASSPSPSVAGAAWEIVDRAPFARIEVATAAHDGVIWLAGGLNDDGSASDETWRYDPGDREWGAGPALPAAVHHAALVSTGEDLLLIGGYQGASFSTPLDTVLRLSGGGEWEGTTPLPEPRAAGAAAWDGERIVYAGGVAVAGAVSRGVLAFDGERWSTVGEMVAPREHLSAAGDGQGRVWLLGGRALSLDSNMATVEYVEGDLVTRIGELPTPRGGAAAFFVPGIGACLAGGEQPTSAFDTVECIGDDLEVTTIAPLAEPRHGHSAAVLDGSVYVLLGGPEPRLTVSDTVQRLAAPP